MNRYVKLFTLSSACSATIVFLGMEVVAYMAGSNNGVYNVMINIYQEIFIEIPLLLFTSLFLLLMLKENIDEEF